MTLRPLEPGCDEFSGPVPCDMPSRPRKGIDDDDSNGMVSCQINWSLENGIDARGPAREWDGVGKCGFSSSSYISCNPASGSEFKYFATDFSRCIYDYEDEDDFFEGWNEMLRLLDDCRYEESIADFRGSQSTPIMTFHVQILQHAASIYTFEAFEKFKDEFCRGIDCKFEIDSESRNQVIYKITPYGKKFHHFVTYDSSKDSISCSCKKFEFASYLYSHALKILTTLNIARIPATYILKRWAKTAKIENVKVSNESSNEIESKARISFRYKELCHLSMQLVTKASESEETYQIAKYGFWKMSKQMDACCQGGKKMKEARPKDNKSVSQDVDGNPSDFDSSKVKGVKVKDRVTY
ncbi:hypothetical protein ACH5RR_040694 [Cinchona calisaya]|uniref:Protein FAR1-RELATED SEQUENCE n=1 Tax=Cinchona calisaya TaxID=153742 RepID=A0ABD2XUI7_9GENT